MSADADVVVVGSGINALVCAALLARAGHRVTVLEAAERLGGCIHTAEITRPGFVHEVMASWYPLFVAGPAWAELEGELTARGVAFCNTDAPTAVLLPDDRHLIIGRDRAGNRAALDRLCPGDGDAWQAALQGLEPDLELTFTLLGAELWSARTTGMLARAAWRRGIGGFSGFIADVLDNARDWLRQAFRGEAVQACLAPWPCHAGIGPGDPLSGLMARLTAFTLEQVGCPVVRGGGRNLVAALASMVTDAGGACRTGCEVDRIRVEGGRARGVVLAGGEAVDARRAVVASVTPGQLYGRLLADAPVPDAVRARARRFRHGRADMQIHLALDSPLEWPHEALSRVAMVHVTEGAAAVTRAVATADAGLLPEAPTVVVGQPTALDPGRAPEGRAVLWLQLLEVPGRVRGDAAGSIPIPDDGRWSEDLRERYADRVIARLARQLPGLEASILERRVLSPADLEALNPNLVGGDPYGGACTLDQYLWWRPLPNVRGHRTPVRDLWHVGASTHPGPGLGAGSGYLVAKAIA